MRIVRTVPLWVSLITGFLPGLIAIIVVFLIALVVAGATVTFVPVLWPVGPLVFGGVFLFGAGIKFGLMMVPEHEMTMIVAWVGWVLPAILMGIGFFFLFRVTPPDPIMTVMTDPRTVLGTVIIASIGFATGLTVWYRYPWTRRFA